MRMRRNVPIAVAAGAVTVGVGAVAFAAIPDSGGAVQACYKTSKPHKGSVIVLDPESTSGSTACPAGYQAFSWRSSLGGYTVMTSNAVQQFPPDTVLITVQCPTGMRPLSGGGNPPTDDAGGPSKWVLSASLPEMSQGRAMGWTVVFKNVGSPPTTPLLGAEGRAICPY